MCKNFDWPLHYQIQLPSALKIFAASVYPKLLLVKTPIPLSDNSKIVLHIIPLAAFDPSIRFDLSSLSDINTLGSLQFIYAGSFSHRNNFDGFLTYIPLSEGWDIFLYLQIFHSGAIEGVDASTIHNGFIPRGYEKGLIGAFKRFLTVQKNLGVELPIVIMLTLLGVSGATIEDYYSQFGIRRPHHIDRNDLLVPEIMIESFDCEPAEVMKPIFDAIWNAAGRPRSLNYNEKGEWINK